VELRLRTRSIGNLARAGIACPMTIAALAISPLVAASSPSAVRSDFPSAAPAARQSAPTLRLGSRGAEVRALQSTLARLSYLPSAGIDGVFGM
jgi:peptidoglycan hydrolase-like protein with peptidoglycan-binding domain